jgi:hypothetical protein
MFNRLVQRKARRIAAERFVAVWLETGLASELIGGYDCTLTCAEADTFAALFATHGHPGTAEWIVEAHTEHDEPGDERYPCSCDNAGWFTCPEHLVES